MDIRLFGIGIAVTFAIIALSAITLYVAFRIKETFRDEKSTRIQTAKIGFILIILFMAGGMFYFFASAMSQSEKSSNYSNINSEIPIIIKDNSTVGNGSLNLYLAYPEKVNANEMYSISFTISNPSLETVHGATLKLAGLGLNEIESSFNIDSRILYLGDLLPGEKSGYVQLKAPAQPMTMEGELMLQSNELNQVAKKIKITVLENKGTSVPLPNSTPASSSPKESPRSPVYIIIEPTANPVSSTPTPAPTQTASPTPAPDPNVTASPTPTPNVTASPTPAPDPNVTASPTPAPDPNVTASPTPAPDPNVTASPTPTPDPNVTASPTPTPGSNVTASPTPIPGSNVTASPTPTPGPNATASPTSAPVSTSTPIVVSIPSPVSTLISNISSISHKFASSNAKMPVP